MKKFYFVRIKNHMQFYPTITYYKNLKQIDFDFLCFRIGYNIFRTKNSPPPV